MPRRKKRKSSRYGKSGCPGGRKIRSKGKGRGLGRGRGSGPRGVPINRKR